MSKQNKVVINDVEVLLQDENSDQQMVECIEAEDSSYIIENEEFVTRQEFTVVDTNVLHISQDGNTLIQYLEPNYQDDSEQNEHQEIGNETEEGSEICAVKSVYSTIPVEEESHPLLHSEGQLYMQIEEGYYRCRLYPQCQALGHVEDDYFYLHNVHSHSENQENVKNNLLINSENIENSDSNVHEDNQQMEYSNNEEDDTRNEQLLTTKNLHHNELSSNIIKEILNEDSDNQDDQEKEEPHPLNNFKPAPFTTIDILGTRVLHCADHLYIHSKNNSYVCYLSPKCFAMGRQFGKTFQLLKPHTKHGFKDNEWTKLRLISAVEKRMQGEPHLLEQIFYELSELPEFFHVKDSISVEHIKKLFMNPNEIKSTFFRPETKETKPFTIIESDEGGHVLFCDSQLYTSQNKMGYYRCRLYQEGCPATGRKTNNGFVLLQSHIGHSNQIDEKIKLEFIAVLKKRALEETSTYQAIYNEEASKPQFAEMSLLVPYKTVSKVMRKARQTLKNHEETETNQTEQFIDSNSGGYEIVSEYNQSHDLEEASETSVSVQEFEESNGNTDMFTETDTGSMLVPSDVTRSNRSEDNRSSRSVVIACAEFTLMEGERLGSCILYCNEHLYTLNRNNYYRCRLYPQGCQATGMREGKYFRLCRGHNGHGSQEPERRRIILINTIKKRTMTCPNAEFFEAVFNEECEKPEYADVVEKVSYTIVLNNMRKIWKRYQRNDPTLTRNIMRNEEVGKKCLEIKEEDKTVSSEPEDRDEHRMAVEVGSHIICDTDLTPREYIMMNGERLGSCILYCNHQLYTNNQKNYYRCRMYSAGCRATGMIKDKLFHLLKQHNGHGSQELEVKRIILITTIKRRAQVDPTRLHTIYKEECARPEFQEVADMVSYKKIYSTLDRCRKRATVEYVDALDPVFPSDLNLDTSSSNQTLNKSGQNDSEYNVDNSWEDVQFESVEDQNTETENIIYQDSINDSSSELVKNTDQSIEDEEISQEFTLKKEVVPEQQTEEMSQEELISQLGLEDSNPETENAADSNSNSHAELDSVARDNEENYFYIGGDRLGSKLLYCEGQLYCLNRDNYFRCRVYPNCIATGRIYGSTFRLHRGHIQHRLQDDEKDRLLLLTALKRRVSDENLPVRQIFDEECARPEFREAATMISYKQILSTLLKCRTRATAVTEKNAENPTEDVEESIEQIEAMLNDYGKCDEENDTDMDTEYELKKEIETDADDSSISDIEDTFLEVPKPDLYTPSKYTLLQGDRTGSRILYSNGHLYTRNRGTYYRCRMHPLCSGAGTVRGRLFQLTRQHADHPLQDDERTRLLLMNSLKRRALKENTSLKIIFDEEVARPEFASIADLVSFKMIQSTMVKCRDRVKYAGELGTILSSAEMAALRCEDDIEEEHAWNDEEDGVESDGEDSVKPPKAKRIKKEPVTEDEEEKHIYYYVLNISGGEDEDSGESEDILADYIQKDVIHTNTAQQDEKTNVCSVKSNNIVVYTVDVNKQIISQQQPKFQCGVHFPDETMSLELNTNDSSTVDSQTPIKYKMVEDCMNDTVVLYAGKQLYTHDKGNRFVCRIKTCKAVGEIKKNAFNLLQPHNQHPLQNKQRLQLKLISTIKKRSLERKTARVAKIFRDECARPEFRTVAGTITLDGVSNMIRRCKKKLYPRTPKILLDMLPEMISTELPPPTEFSVIHGTKPGIRLIFCDGGLFYHEGNGYYSCYIPECTANGRRDRMFFQLLKSHTDHDILDVNDKDSLLPIIKELELKLSSNKQKKTPNELYEDDVPSETKSIKDNVEKVFKKEIQSDDECNETLTDNSVESSQLINEHNSPAKTAENNSPNQKNILQQAWEDLQIRI